MKWLRVSRKRRCEICRRPDWCGYTDDGAACCMRVESDKPTRNGGWLHKTDESFAPVYVPPKRVEEKPVDIPGIWKRWLEQTDSYHLDGFAMSLGVDTDALRFLGCAWTGKEWAFPMRDDEGSVIGIRLRNDAGQKWAVKGSRQGLFFSTAEPERTLWICEGPTDTAAALTLGLCAIGRPSCLGQEAMIAEYIKAHRVSRVVIVTDNDEPGLRGAAKLQGILKVPNCIWNPPAKDIREFVNLGGDRAMVDASVRDIVWTYTKEKGRVASPPHRSSYTVSAS